MNPLSVVDPQLSSSVQKTLQILLTAGISIAGIHSFTVGQLKTLGITAGGLRELATAGVVAVTIQPGGSVVRPMTTVATEVVLHDSGDVDVTLALDLI